VKKNIIKLLLLQEYTPQGSTTMPELPEVETVVKGLQATLTDSQITNLKFFRKDIREPIPTQTLKKIFIKEKIQQVFRRAKYIIVETKKGFGIFHLGMSGKFLVSNSKKSLIPHTHASFTVEKNNTQTFLHYIDPRRFGLLSAHLGADWRNHKRIKHLGVEPLETRNLGQHLWSIGKNSSQNIKTFIMNAKNVVGVGNIYACEALFKSNINPILLAKQVSLKQYQLLAKNIKKTLRTAIESGGTTLKDFQNALGQEGFFQTKLYVYNRKDEKCHRCKTKISQISQGGRSTWFCSNCQK
jgi:formamidopyrimidine-DNA glycosylase